MDYFIVRTQLIEPNDKDTTRLVTLIELIFAHLPRVGRDIMTDFAHLPLEGRELNLLTSSHTCLVGRDTNKPSLEHLGGISPNIFAHLPGRPRWKLIRYVT